MSVYYNEFDPKKAAWLRELMRAGAIAPGDVDERSITEVQPADLAGYTQCHFFAGIGVWSYALRLAGWADDRPVWTGSCPCQPFSTAGKGGGVADARHLWPDWFRLIRECCPRTVFGEQVASPAGLAWLDLVSADLESAGYAGAATDLCAASVGAPHIRQRLWFVAESHEERSRRQEQQFREAQRGSVIALCADVRNTSSENAKLVADADDPRSQRRGLLGATGDGDGAGERAAREAGVADDRLEHPASVEREVALQHSGSGAAPTGERETNVHRSGSPTGGYWKDADWLPCIDGKARPVEPGTFPLAHGTPARVGRLRGYGDAIVAPLAAEWIAAYRDVTESRA